MNSFDSYLTPINAFGICITTCNSLSIYSETSIKFILINKFEQLINIDII